MSSCAALIFLANRPNWDELRDIEASRKAKVMMGSVTWGYNSRDALQQQQPDFLFTSPADIVKALS